MFLKRSISEKILFSEAEITTNFDIGPANIHVQRFTGCIFVWSLVKNDRPIKKNDSLTSTWRSLFHVFSPLFPPVGLKTEPTCIEKV